MLLGTGMPGAAAGTCHGFLHRQKKSSEILKSLENERQVFGLSTFSAQPSFGGQRVGRGGFGVRMSYESQGYVRKFSYSYEESHLTREY